MNHKPDNINKFLNVFRSPLKILGLVSIVLLLAGIVTAWTYTNPPRVDCFDNGTCVNGNTKWNETTFIAESFYATSNITAGYHNTTDGRELQNGGCNAAYCIRYNLTNSSLIEVVNGSNGKVDYSGQFSDVLNNIPDGSYIYLSPGNYSLDSQVTKNNTIISSEYGSAGYSKIAKITSSVDGYAFRFLGGWNKIRGVRLIVPTNGSGIFFDDASAANEITNSRIEGNTGGTGVYANFTDIYISNVRVINFTNPFTCATCADSHITGKSHFGGDNLINSTASFGINLLSSTNILIHNTDVWGNYANVRLANSNKITISDSNIEYAQRYGIYIIASSTNSHTLNIYNNRIFENGQRNATYSNTSSVFIDAQNSKTITTLQIHDNSMGNLPNVATGYNSSTQEYGIFETSPSQGYVINSTYYHNQISNISSNKGIVKRSNTVYSFQNFGDPGYNHGNRADCTTITAFGSLDTCGNTTLGLPMWWNGTFWVKADGTRP